MSKTPNTAPDELSVKTPGRGAKALRIAGGAVLTLLMIVAIAAHNTYSKNRDVTIPITPDSDSESRITDPDTGSAPEGSALETDSAESSKTESRSASSKAASSKDTSSKAQTSKSASSKAASSKAASSKPASDKASSTAQAAAPRSTTQQGNSQQGTSSSGTSPSPEVAEPVVIPEAVAYERFDEDGRLIIDTDTLDGQKAVAITFDDGPSQFTRQLIDGLNARGAKATFFMVGSNVERYPDLLPLMVEGGHQIGNHTYNHPYMTSLSEYQWRNEIAVTDEAIYNACGQYATAFRPPYGAYTQYCARTVDKTFTIWSVDTLDWKTRNTQSVYNEIMANTKDGSIILLHDLYETSVNAALSAIDSLQAQGYIFVTVDELMTRYGYPISNTAHFSQYPVTQTILIPKEETTDTQQPEPSTDTDAQTDAELQTDSDDQTETDARTDSETSSSEPEDTETENEEEQTDDPGSAGQDE